MTKFYLYAAALLILSAGLSGLYFYAYSSGKQDAKFQQLKAAVQAEKTRREIENGIKTYDSYTLCINLGGLPDTCNELRWMDAKPQDQ